MAVLNKVFLQNDGLQVGNNQLVVSGGNVLVGNTLAIGNTVIVPNISVNGSIGSAGQALLSGGSTSNAYWGVAGVNTASQYTFTNTITFNSSVYFGAVPSTSFLASGAPILEPVNANGSATTGTVSVNASNGGILYLTSNLTGSLTLNFIGNSSVTFNSLLANAQSMSFSIITSTGATGYTPTSIQVDGTATGVTVKYLYGGSFVADSNATHLYNFIVIKTAATPTYTILASQTSYA